MARFITGLYHRAGIAAGSSRSGRRTLLDRLNRSVAGASSRAARPALRRRFFLSARHMLPFQNL
jgi:hypothetical protein